MPPSAAPPSPSRSAEISRGGVRGARATDDGFEEPAEDTVSTVMFRASDLPWGAPPQPPQPLLRPSRWPSRPRSPCSWRNRRRWWRLMRSRPRNPRCSRRCWRRTSSSAGRRTRPKRSRGPDVRRHLGEPFGEVAATVEPQEEEDIFASELTARSPVSGVEEGTSGAFAALVRDQVPVPDGASDTNTFAEPLRVPAASEPPPAGLRTNRRSSRPSRRRRERAGGRSGDRARAPGDRGAVVPRVAARRAAGRGRAAGGAGAGDVRVVRARPGRRGAVRGRARAAQAEAEPASAAEAAAGSRRLSRWPGRTRPRRAGEPQHCGRAAARGASRSRVAVREPEPSHASFEPEPPRVLFEPVPAAARTRRGCRRAPVAVAAERHPVPPAVAGVPEESFGDVAETLAESEPRRTRPRRRRSPCPSTWSRRSRSA